MFSDRFWILKLALATGALVALCHRARTEFEKVQPSFRKAPVYFEKVRGKIVTNLWAKPVTAHAPDGFDISTDLGLFRVISPERPPIGERVSLVARVTGPRTLEASAVQRNEGVSWKRPVNYIVSILTVAIFLLWARRRFRWPLHEGLFRSRSRDA
jgi:hypothetical protein